MEDLDPSLFSKITAMKKKNKALKVMIALGGWTFNDPGPTQTVFHDVVSSKANRSKFIGNLMSFMRQYAFDGVDFDWVGDITHVSRFVEGTVTLTWQSICHD